MYKGSEAGPCLVCLRRKEASVARVEQAGRREVRQKVREESGSAMWAWEATIRTSAPVPRK